ncbi:helix-turn-helix domain-containing protein [Dictyobacter kobayashii]|nr:helix-turn-helix transcriptional regulator [Dictyobacter kobayashii]
MLKSARVKRAWTPEFVSEQVGVSRNTYIRWESGAQMPRQASLNALCKVFALSPAELGFVGNQMKRTHTLEPEAIVANLSDDQPEGVEEDDEIDDPEQDLSASLLAWSAGLASCWRWYLSGGQRELERLAPTYLNRLMKPTLTPGPEQKLAASLTSQVYQLIALLDLQRGDFSSAQTNGTQALVYSQLAKDWNVYVAAQIRMATIFSARKRIGSALNAYNDALHRINADDDSISPILHSWIFAGLAEIQATMGRETEALQFLKLAIAVFPEKPEEDTCIAYAQCDHSMLYLYQGLVFLRLGQPKLAWEAFSQVDDFKPVPSERMRAEFLRYRAYTSLVLGNMIQSCIYLEAAARAARAINSDLAFSEIYALYEHMLAIWGQEPRVKALASLFQS